MRGGFLHNDVLLGPVESHFRACHARIDREFPTRPGRDAKFIDLFVNLHGLRIACEAELTTRRIGRDIDKAREVNAQLLLIVVPHRRVARYAMERVVDPAAVRRELALWILPLGPALARLRSCFPIPALPNVGNENEKETRDAWQVRA